MVQFGLVVAVVSDRRPFLQQDPAPRERRYSKLNHYLRLPKNAYPAVNRMRSFGVRQLAAAFPPSQLAGWDLKPRC